MGLPLEVADRGGTTGVTGGSLGRVVSRIDRVGVTLAPTLFAYQFLYELEPVPA